MTTPVRRRSRGRTRRVPRTPTPQPALHPTPPTPPDTRSSTPKPETKKHTAKPPKHFAPGGEGRPKLQPENTPPTLAAHTNTPA